MTRIALMSFVVLAACAQPPQPVEFSPGDDQDPVVALARQTLVLNLDTCARGTTQGPRRLLTDDFSTTHVNDPAWPMTDGYDAEFNGDWTTDGVTARVTNPSWPGAGTAPARPVTTGIVKFIDVCPLPASALSLSALADTTLANDTITDVTMVLYVFDGAANLLDVRASYALRAGNRRPVVLAGVPLPLTARRVAVVPMARLGPTERSTVFIDDLSLTVDETSTIINSFSDDFSSATTNQYGAGQPNGWGEWGGADFFIYKGAWATVWNATWGGDARSLPPFEGGAFRTVQLSGVHPGDLLEASVLSANTFKDPTSYSMLRLTHSGVASSSAKLQGSAWGNLVVSDGRIVNGELITVELLVGFGPKETDSLYFDSLVVNARRPSATLRAARTYSPATNYDGVLDFPRDALIQVPESLPIDTQTYSGAAVPWSLMAGNSANQTATVTFTLAAGGTVVCSYVGGGGVSHPTTSGQLSNARSYTQPTCTDGSVSGKSLTVRQVRVSIVNGDSNQPATRVAVPLSWSYP